MKTTKERSQVRHPSHAAPRIGRDTFHVDGSDKITVTIRTKRLRELDEARTKILASLGLRPDFSESKRSEYVQALFDRFPLEV